jgi:hypothetical protein
MRVKQVHDLPAARPRRHFADRLVLIMALSLIGPCVGSGALAQAPGPELFAKEPRTSLEIWDAIDYLLRTKQATKALPYINRFMQSKPDDATLIAIRNRYGPGSILRLSDDQVTQPFAKPMTEAMLAAAHKYATRPERITKFIGELTKTPEEQEYAVRHLREAGPEVIPFLVEALSRPDYSADNRTQIVRSMGRLDRSVIPPLAAVLDSPDEALATDAAKALALIGDKEAVPYLTFPAASPNTSAAVRAAAQGAIGYLTGRPFSAQARTPVQVLTNTAWRYHRHQVEFPDDPALVWDWDNNRKLPVSRQVSTNEAEGIQGLKFVQQALRLDPRDRDAQVAQLSLALESSIKRVGFDAFPTKDEATWNSAKASGPLILAQVLKTAIADSKTDLAAVAAMALGQIIDRATLAATGQPHPLVDALYAPGRRVQFAAAKALVNLPASGPFPGSSRVVPTLTRFVNKQSLPRAVVIDGNPNRGSQLAGFLINLGYDAELELTGNQGFTAAAASADVDLVFVSYDLFRAGWGLDDTLAKLQADSRTAATPIYVYGPINVQYRRPNLEHDYPGIKFLVQPGNPDMLQQQLKGLPTPLQERERARYAREAAELLAQVATTHKSPLTADLTVAEPVLAAVLNTQAIAQPAAVTLANIPDPDAQRSLADLVLDPSQPTATRKEGAALLVRSIKQFGRLVTAAQEARLVTGLREEADLGIRADLLTVLKALLPVPSAGLPQRQVPPIPAAVPVQSPTPPVPPQ